jgi:preprotein translocase subunit SecE
MGKGASDDAPKLSFASALESPAPTRMADTLRTVRDFLADVQTEIQKVTWPDWPQLKNSTYVILVFLVVVALLIFGIDSIVNYMLEMLRGILKG